MKQIYAENPRGVPINIPTRQLDVPFKQVGFLTKDNSGSDPTILPLFGKPTYPGSSSWNYYTGNDKYNSIKLHNNNENIKRPRGTHKGSKNKKTINILNDYQYYIIKTFIYFCFVFSLIIIANAIY